MKYLLVGFLCMLLWGSIPSRVQAISASEAERYIWQKRVVRSISPQADELRRELARQIQQMIAAGHLAPYRIALQENEAYFLWYHAGEPIYTLASALPFLPDGDAATRQALIEYLHTEFRTYRPYIPTALWDTAPWLPFDKGTRREHYPLPPDYLSSVPNYQMHPIIQTLYHTWAYVDATKDTSVLSSDWSAISSLYDKLKNRGTTGWKDDGGCIAKYGDIAGCIGMARLAHLAGKSSVAADAAGRAVTGLTAGENFATFEENSYNQARYFTEVGGDDADQTANKVRTWVYLNLFPETGRFLSEHNRSAVEGHLQKVTTNVPTWYAVLSPGFIGGEVSTATPFLNYPIFQAYGLALRKDPAFLHSRLDVPLAKVGDLYHLQNMVTTIAAYGQTCWVDIRTNQEQCEGTPSLPPTTPTPSPTLTTCSADINQDHQVDLTDYTLLVSVYLRSGVSSTRPDINRDGMVDIADYVILVGQFLKPCQ